MWIRTISPPPVTGGSLLSVILFPRVPFPLPTVAGRFLLSVILVPRVPFPLSTVAVPFPTLRPPPPLPPFGLAVAAQRQTTRTQIASRPRMFWKRRFGIHVCRIHVQLSELKS